MYGHDGGVAAVCKIVTLIHRGFESLYTHNILVVRMAGVLSGLENRDVGLTGVQVRSL